MNYFIMPTEAGFMKQITVSVEARSMLRILPKWGCWTLAARGHENFAQSSPCLLDLDSPTVRCFRLLQATYHPTGIPPQISLKSSRIPTLIYLNLRLPSVFVHNETRIGVSHSSQKHTIHVHILKRSSHQNLNIVQILS